MKQELAYLTTLTLLSLALSCSAIAATAPETQTAPATAPAKSSCLMFCGGTAAKAAAAAKLDASANGLPGSSFDLDIAIEQAQTARRGGDLTTAAKILSQLVLVSPDDPRVLGEYGKTLAAQGRSDDALAFLERAIQLQPNDWSLYSAQGVAYDQKSAFPEAQGSYNHALSLKPGEPTALNNAALSRMQAGDLEGAKILLDQAAPGTAKYPRIAENRALVQNLMARAAQSKPVAVAEEKLQAAPAPAPVAAANPEPAPAVVAVVPAPAPKAAPVAVHPAPAAAAPVVTAELSAPKANPAPEAGATKLAELQRDPTVRMAPVPKDDAPAAATAAPKVIVPAKLAAEAAPPPAPKLTPRPAQNGPMTYYVQAGSYNSQERAGKQAQTLDSLGARVWPGTVSGHAVYRVRIGPFLDIKQANAAVDEAHTMGQTDVKIVSE
jgi:Flp pilus assembly protein TadD